MPMPGEVALRVFRFGVFEANEAAGELRKHGVRIKLHSQSFLLLTMLLEKPSDVVTREEMRHRLWGNDTFVDFDHGLNTAVNKIREALGDSASTPRYVETISGRGYRFIAPVIRGGPAASPPAPPAAIVTEAETVSSTTLLTGPDELPAASQPLVRTLLLLVQTMYLAFYLGALANLPEIHDIFVQSDLLPPAGLMTTLIVTAAILIPIRLYLFSALAFDFQNLASKFGKLFPVLLILDLLWALSPFLLIHHISTGLALGISAALLYLPFAQRSLVLMYGRGPVRLGIASVRADSHKQT
jgi:cholera toxin transcriptional activator